MMEAAASKDGCIADFFDLVLAPAFNWMGDEWAAGRLNIMQEHRASQLVAAALGELHGTIQCTEIGDIRRPLVVSGSPAKVHGALGSAMLQLVLGDLGWRTIDLGGDTPFSAFRKVLETSAPRLVCLSIAHTPTSMARFQSDLKGFAEVCRGQSVDVAIGGFAVKCGAVKAPEGVLMGESFRQLVETARRLEPAVGRTRRMA